MGGAGLSQAQVRKPPMITVGLVKEILLQAMRTRRKWVAATFGAALCVGIALAALQGKKTWEATGTLLCTPLPVAEAQKGLYTPPDMATLVSLVKSPPVLSGLLEEFQLPVPASVLEKIFKVTAPRTTQTVSVSLQWAEGEMAERMTNRLMQRFVDLVQKQRAERLGRYLEDYELRMLEGTDKYRKASEAFHAFLKNRDFSDSKSETENLLKEIATLREAKAHAGRSEKTVLAQKERLCDEIENFKKTSATEEEGEKEFVAAQESVSDNRRRQDRLRELIDDEKKRTEVMAELTVKRKEYERMAKLRASGAVSQMELDDVAKNVEILTSRITDSESVRKWKQELINIDQVVVPKSKSRSTGSPIIQQTLFRKLEFDLQLIGLQKEIFEIDRSLASLQRRQEEIRSLALQADGLQKEMESFDLERTRLSEQIALFQRLRDQKSGEFTIISPAVAGAYPIASSRKLWFIIGFAGACMAGFGCIVGEQVLRLRNEGRFPNQSSGLPSLPDCAVEDEESLRRFATALRRWLPEFGATVLFTGPPDSECGTGFVRRAAKMLTARRESVLVVDTRRESADQDLEWGIDPPFGLVRMPMDQYKDAWASPETRDWFRKARETYSSILVLAPDTTHASLLELLDVFADGICFYSGQGRVPKDWNATLISLDERMVAPKRLIQVSA